MQKIDKKFITLLGKTYQQIIFLSKITANTTRNICIKERSILNFVVKYFDFRNVDDMNAYFKKFEFLDWEYNKHKKIDAVLLANVLSTETLNNDELNELIIFLSESFNELIQNPFSEIEYKSLCKLSQNIPSQILIDTITPYNNKNIKPFNTPITTLIVHCLFLSAIHDGSIFHCLQKELPLSVFLKYKKNQLTYPNSCNELIIKYLAKYNYPKDQELLFYFRKNNKYDINTPFIFDLNIHHDVINKIKINNIRRILLNQTYQSITQNDLSVLRYIYEHHLLKKAPLYAPIPMQNVDVQLFVIKTICETYKKALMLLFSDTHEKEFSVFEHMDIDFTGLFSHRLYATFFIKLTEKDEYPELKSMTMMEFYWCFYSAIAEFLQKKNDDLSVMSSNYILSIIKESKINQSSYLVNQKFSTYDKNDLTASKKLQEKILNRITLMQ